VRIELEADRFLAQIGFGQHGPGSLVQAFHRCLRHLGKKRLRVPGRSHHTGNARPNRRCPRSLRKNALTAAKPSQAKPSRPIEIAAGACSTGFTAAAQTG
jgi:hypothetical protein